MNKPAKMIKRDYYDFIKLSSHRVAIVLGNVYKKKLPASLLITNTQTTIHRQTYINLTTNQCLEKSNTFLYQNTNPKTFISLPLVKKIGSSP